MTHLDLVKIVWSGDEDDAMEVSEEEETDRVLYLWSLECRLVAVLASNNSFTLPLLSFLTDELWWKMMVVGGGR